MVDKKKVILSSKNFQLVESKPTKKFNSDYLKELKISSDFQKDIEKTLSKGTRDILKRLTEMQSPSETESQILSVDVSQTPSPSAAKSTQIDPSTTAVTKAEKIYFQLVKLDENEFDCVFQAPINYFEAFLICLSRFETVQKY